VAHFGNRLLIRALRRVALRVLCAEYLCGYLTDGGVNDESVRGAPRPFLSFTAG
jgi:hypothetical protein